MPIGWWAQSQSGREPSAAKSRLSLDRHDAQGGHAAGQEPSWKEVTLYQGMTPELSESLHVRIVQLSPSLGSQQVPQPGNSGPSQGFPAGSSLSLRSEAGE